MTRNTNRQRGFSAVVAIPTPPKEIQREYPRRQHLSASAGPREYTYTGSGAFLLQLAKNPLSATFAVKRLGIPSSPCPFTLPTVRYDLPPVIDEYCADNNECLKLQAHQLGGVRGIAFCDMIAGYEGQALRPVYRNHPSITQLDWHDSYLFREPALGRIGVVVQQTPLLAIDRARTEYEQPGKAAVHTEALLLDFDADTEVGTPELPEAVASWQLALDGLNERWDCPGYAVNCATAHFSA